MVLCGEYTKFKPGYEHEISQDDNEKESSKSPQVTIILDTQAASSNGDATSLPVEAPPTRRNMGIKRRMSTAVVYILGGESRRTSTWSIFSLKEEFKKADIENLYERYWLKLHRYLLFKLYVMLSIYNIGILILYNTSGYVQKGRLTITILYGVSALISMLIAGIAFIRKMKKRAYVFLTFFTWIYLMSLIAALIVPSVMAGSFKGTEHIPYSFIAIFAIHTMVPTSRRMSVALGSVCALTDVAVCAVLSYPPYESYGSNTKLLQLIANAFILLCSNLTGLYLKHFTDIAHRQMFLDTRNYIEANIRFERQRKSQSKEKEKLLLKIIPKHLLQDIQQSIHERLEMKESLGRVFGDLLVARHNHVSILYADIVSFTPLTANMEPKELVHALNQLFGRFDEIAKTNKCMRIKILGDCYYCVSGLPDPIPDHARNCVIMGMQMIKVIEHIRKETGVKTLDMRIGINTGWVLSGVLGTKKWQYDVWSDDVATANHMESGGLPGKVHLTKATLCELNGEFDVVPGTGQERDDFLKENNVETYLIHDNEMKKINIDHILRSAMTNGCASPAVSLVRRKQSMADCMGGWGAENPFDSLSQDVMERTLPERVEVNRRLERAFHLDGFAGQRDIIPDTNDRAIQYLIDPFTLNFKDKGQESLYSKKFDPSYKFYVAGAFVIFLFMSAVQVILIRSTSLYICMGSGGFLFMLLLLLTSITSLKKKDNGGMGPHFLKSLKDLSSRKRMKEFICFLCAIFILICSCIPVIPCEKTNKTLFGTDELVTEELTSQDQTMSTDTASTFAVTESNSTNLTTQKGKEVAQPCLFATYYVFCCMISLIACCVFLRVSYLYKSVYMVLCLIFFNIMFFIFFEDMFRVYDQAINNNLISTKVLGSYYTAVLFVMLVVLNRQIEQHLRVAYLCKLKISENRSEVDLNNKIKEKLLCNILPQHVADHFSNADRNKQELYHEDYRNACVMFAAIPNFKVFFSNVDVTGTECLRLLNEIISAFDSLLTEHHNIEKIKTIGSTYMAAAGLGDGDDKQVDEVKAADNAKNMAMFARSMVYKLIELSHDAFYEYELRIGMNHGQVLAGVVGAQKPIYDIWGDAVNIASRMESHGVSGKIQVPEQTANLLERRGVKCTIRDGGPFKIKGKKDPMNVFFVDVPTLSENIL